MALFSLDELEAATAIVRTFVPPTPAYAWPLLAARAGAEVIVKHENHTPTGSFKARGGLVYVEALRRAGRMPNGLVTATRGNHGQSVAAAAARYGIPAIIVVPERNSSEKNAAMEAFGGELVTAGKDFDESRAVAAEIQRERGYLEIRTPQVVDMSLLERSGHADKFGDDMFMLKSEDREFAVKPMNCPCHVQVFNQGLKSYRDLPLRLAEFGSCHRNEPSGSLHGIMRVRGFVQDDAGVQVEVLDLETSRTETLRVRYLVGCDGGSSGVRKKMGARLEGTDVIQRVQSTFIRAPGLAALLPGKPAWCYYSVNPRRCGTVFAIDGAQTWLVHNHLNADEPGFDSVDRDQSIRNSGQPVNNGARTMPRIPRLTRMSPTRRDCSPCRPSQNGSSRYP